MKQTKSKNEQLRQYIEKLLSMKREEIANLSVSTETSRSFPSNTDSIGSDFVSSTPASILTSSSSTGSKSSSGQSKSVRFRDDVLDGSFTPATTNTAIKERYSPGNKETEERRKEILRQTRVSLEHVQSYYEEQRRRIELELEKRKKSSEADKENRSPISISSSSSEFASNTSTKETSGDDCKVEKRTQIRRISHSATHRQLSLNKSSSSGTTTSGSVATVELLQRLKRLEMPSLKRPSSRKPTSSMDKDDLNTSADMKKAPELDSSPAIETSFRFSTDLGETSGREDNQQTQIALSSSSSS